MAQELDVNQEWEVTELPGQNCFFFCFFFVFYAHSFNLFGWRIKKIVNWFYGGFILIS